MAWTPSTSILYDQAELYEFQNINVQISYTDPLQPTETWTCTITPSEVKPTISTSNSAIVGFYSNSFDGYSIQFLDKDNMMQTVSDFSSITNAREIIKYFPAMQQYKPFTYNVTATSTPSNLTATTTFTVIVTNSWDIGKNNLLAAIAATKG